MMQNKKIKNASPKEYNGITYRSQLEARVAKELDLNNLPFKYESEKLELLPKMKYDGTAYRAVHYTPDFIVGNYIVEVKGFPNDRWPLVKKLTIHKIITENLPYIFKEVHNLTELRTLIKEIKDGKN